MWWTALQILTFLDHDDGSLIQRVVALRKQCGVPIQRLRIGSSQELINLSWYAWLNKNVDLQGFSDIDSWPGSVNELDADDDLFN